METFVPGFRENILALTGTLRVAVYFVCVVGLMVQVHAAGADVQGFVRPIGRAIVIIGLVATLPTWFEFTEKLFLSAANVIEEGYTEHPMRAATLLRETVQEKSDSEFTLRRVGESLYRAFLSGAAKLIVLIGSLLQLPFLLLQYILKLLSYLFLPVALALFMVPSLASLGTRYIQQSLAVLAWPVGFAVTELVAYHLITAYQTNVAIANGIVVGEIDAASFASLLGGLLGSLWLLIGTLGTPVLMQMLFCSGSPVSSGGQSALQQLFTMQQVAFMVKSIKTAGAAAPLAVAQAASKGSAGSGNVPPPPQAPRMAAAASPMIPQGDFAGDKHAASLIAQAQLPASKTTI